MGKHIDKLGKIEDFVAPWETDAGEVEIDKDRLKKFIFNLKHGEAKALDAVDEKVTELTNVTTERDEVKSKLEKGSDPELAKELEKERTKSAQEKERADKAERLNLVNEVAASKGLSPDQAKRLQGTTKEELESDADDLLKTFGVSGKTDDEDEGGEGESLRRTPARLTNPTDAPGDAGGSKKSVDYEAVALGVNPRYI